MKFKTKIIQVVVVQSAHRVAKEAEKTKQQQKKFYGKKLNFYCITFSIEQQGTPLRVLQSPAIYIYMDG